MICNDSPDGKDFFTRRLVMLFYLGASLLLIMFYLIILALS